jgi:cobalt/nickel transport system permease protein
MKLLLLLAFLVSLALLRSASGVQLFIYFAYLLMIMRSASLPLLRFLRFSLIVIPFVGIFSLLVYLGGDAHHAGLILCKSYLSALAVMVCLASTPLPLLLDAARSLYIPAFLVELTQLVYRYLFVLSGEIQVMRIAFLARGGRAGRRACKSAAGMVAVLFGRALAKAGAVHNAMLSRGFSGISTSSLERRVHTKDVAVLLAGVLMVILVHFI